MNPALNPYFLNFLQLLSHKSIALYFILDWLCNSGSNKFWLVLYIQSCCSGCRLLSSCCKRPQISISPTPRNIDKASVYLNSQYLGCLKSWIQKWILCRRRRVIMCWFIVEQPIIMVISKDPWPVAERLHSGAATTSFYDLGLSRLEHTCTTLFLPGKRSNRQRNGGNYLILLS